MKLVERKRQSRSSIPLFRKVKKAFTEEEESIGNGKREKGEERERWEEGLYRRRNCWGK